MGKPDEQFARAGAAAARAWLGLALICGALTALAVSEWSAGGLLGDHARFAVLYVVSVAGFAVLATAAASVASPPKSPRT